MSSAPNTQQDIDHEFADLPAPIKVTDSAAHKIAELMLEEENLELKLKVYVEGGGCSGYKYGFEFIEEADPDYFIIPKQVSIKNKEQMITIEVQFVVDPMSAQLLMGAEIDYQKDLKGESFIVKNPGAKSTCGCGSSFDA